MQGVTEKPDMSSFSGFVRGARDVVPILFGVFPVGIAFGVSAREFGFSALEASLMSLVVFAGASQFIGVALIASGAGLLEVAITTFFVNLRHAVMSASISVYLRDAGRALLSVLAFWLTDETFGLSISSYHRGERSPWYLLGASLPFYLNWNAGTLAGYLAGDFLPEELRSAMAFSLSAVFISLLVLSCRDRIAVAVVTFSALLSMVLYLGGVDFGNVVLVCLAGASLGLVLERWKEK